LQLYTIYIPSPELEIRKYVDDGEEVLSERAHAGDRADAVRDERERSKAMPIHSQATQESKKFAIDTIQRSRRYAADFTVRIYGEAPRPLKGDALISLLRTNMWREYILGVEGPARLISLIPHEFLHLKHLLGTQIEDEMRHSRVFSGRVSELGGDGELANYAPTEEDWGLVKATLDFDNPAELVTSLNCSGEVIVQQTFMRLVERKLGKPGIVDDETAEVIEHEVLYDDEDEELIPPVVDEQTAEELRQNVIPDEGRHVKIGRLVLQEFAITDGMRERCREVQDSKFAALDASHGRAVAEAVKLQGAAA
jgi:hypothetical protein